MRKARLTFILKEGGVGEEKEEGEGGLVGEPRFPYSFIGITEIATAGT